MSADDPVARAVEVLLAGGLVGLPTETVYGLAVDASNPAAVARMFAAKGRPADHPVIVHLAEARAIADWAVDIPAAAWQLAAAFWPGPLTIILKRAPHVADAITGGQDTVGLRVPAHPVAHAVLAAFARARAGRPAGVAAPSANTFGRVSPTTAAHVREEFGDAVDFVLDGGQSAVGIESTIVDLSSGAARVLRPGRITAAQVAAVLGSAGAAGAVPSPVPRVSGALDSHYAPRTPTLLVAGADLPAWLDAHAGRRVALLSPAAPARDGVLHWPAPADAEVYAHALYATLRAMDAAGCDLIVVQAPPQGGAWDGVNDRLRRAAHPAPA
ncbi:MAG: threonylcarbamoyl-AMP synthase [Burkholderiales bacterium]|nr:threonylcarbamoyl-AMP synthase [Burkholderiales bacterium]